MVHSIHHSILIRQGSSLGFDAGSIYRYVNFILRFIQIYCLFLVMSHCRLLYVHCPFSWVQYCYTQTLERKHWHSDPGMAQNHLQWHQLHNLACQQDSSHSLSSRHWNTVEGWIIPQICPDGVKHLFDWHNIRTEVIVFLANMMKVILGPSDSIHSLWILMCFKQAGYADGHGLMSYEERYPGSVGS